MASGEWGVASGKNPKVNEGLTTVEVRDNFKLNLNSRMMLNLSHKNLELYKLSLQLVKEVYALTGNYPKEEQFVLVSQMKRAVISVSSNVAEGASRISKPEKKRF